MAELAAVSSIAGLLSLAIQVIDISHRYFSGVKNTSKTIKAYFRELELLRLVLTEIGTLARDEEVALHLRTIDSSSIDACAEELGRVASKLRKRSCNSAFNRLSWPFAEEETRRVIETLHRYENSFHTLLSASSLKLNAEILQSVRSVKSQGDEHLKRQVITWLSVADPLDNHTAARDKHEAGTGQWFLGSREFSCWQDNPSQFLWINGIPGAGKSVLCSTIIDHLLRVQGANEFITYFYFDFRDDRKQTLECALRSLIAQVCYRADEIPGEVQALFDRNGVSNTAPMDRLLLINVLHSLGDRFGPIKIVFDAIDEASQRPNLLNFLKDLTANSTGMLQWLVTSRREHDITGVLSLCASGTVCLDERCIDGDIRTHVKGCLLRDPVLSMRPPSVKDRIEDVLVHKAHGMFRWVECQLEELRRCMTSGETESALADLPRDIDETYAKILLSINWRQWPYARAALELLAFSKRRLSIEEMAEAVVVVPVCKPFDPGDRLFDPYYIVAICAGLIVREEPSGDYALAHYSVQEYLLSERIRRSRVSYFALTEVQANTNISETCLSYLLSIGEIAGYHSIAEDYPFLQYAARYWLEHASSDLQHSLSSVSNLMIQLLDAHNGAYSLLSTFSDLEGFAYAGASPRWIPSPVGQVLGLLPRATINIIIRRPGFLELPAVDLLMAVFEVPNDWAEEKNQLKASLRHIFRVLSTPDFDLLVRVCYHIVAGLRQCDAETLFEILEKQRDAVFTEIVRRAIIEDRPGMLEFLLPFGFHKQIGGNLRSSALALSIVHGGYFKGDDTPSTFQSLLDAGVDINSTSALHGTPMMALLGLKVNNSSRRGSNFDDVLDGLQQLLVRGADVNVKGGEYGTALVAACARHGPEDHDTTLQLVEKLLKHGADVHGRGFRFASGLHAALADPNGPSVELVSRLLDVGIDPNLECPFNGVPLHALLKSSSMHLGRKAEALVLLLDAGADPFRKDAKGRSALALAANRGYRCIFQHDFSAATCSKASLPCGCVPHNFEPSYLIETFLENAKYLQNDSKMVENDIASAFYECCVCSVWDIKHYGPCQTVQEFPREEDFVLDPNSLAWPRAVGRGPEQIPNLLLKHLVQMRPSPETLGIVFRTAPQRGSVAAVRALLDAGVDVNAPNPRNGMTAIQSASRAGHLEVVKILLDFGAHIDNIRAAIDDARLERHSEIALLLETAVSRARKNPEARLQGIRIKRCHLELRRRAMSLPPYRPRLRTPSSTKYRESGTSSVQIVNLV